ncbi:MAG: hypothetical protein DRJ47_01310 [Thermoprotei archaeon]|nr:MAG: hypothetical protein DRJ47_01310 [Thermoprotei archaeon]
MKPAKPLLLIFFTTIGSSLSMLAYMVLIEPNFIIVEELHIKSRELPSSFDGFRIVHISDLHLKGIGFRESYSLDIIRSLRPDIIVVTGDLFERSHEGRLAIEYLRNLIQLAPVIMVYGNHEHWSGFNLNYFKKMAENIGVKVLVNEYVILKRGEDLLIVVGVDDPYTGNADLEKALDFNVSGFTLLLSHSPQIVDSASGKVDLILTGHTHGGQIFLPLIGPLFIPLPPKYRKYHSGIFHLNNTLLYVNRGLGTSFWVRFLSPPEITLIVLETDKG